MASNDPLLDILHSSAQARLQGYGRGSMVMPIAAGLAALRPENRALQAFQAFMQANNIQKYNQQVYDAAIQEAERKALKEAGLGKHYEGFGIPTVTVTDSQGRPRQVYLDKDQYEALAPRYGNQQFNEGIDRIAKRQEPQFGALAPADQVRQSYKDFIMDPDRQSLERQDFYNRMQQANPYGKPTPQMIPPQAMGQPGAMQTGATYQEPPPSSMDRFLTGQYLADPDQINTAIHNQNTDRLNQQKFTEIEKPESQAKLKGNYYKKWPPNPPAGRGINEQELLLQLYGPDQLRKMGYGVEKGKKDIPSGIVSLMAQYEALQKMPDGAQLGKTKISKEQKEFTRNQLESLKRHYGAGLMPVGDPGQATSPLPPGVISPSEWAKRRQRK